MRAAVFELASEVIRAANRQNPADRLLREVIHRRRGVSAEETREASHAVFAFYRWFGWIAERRGLGAQLQQAMQLTQRFDETPESFTDSELREKVVPAWVKAEVEIPPALARALQRQPRLWIRARRGRGKHLARSLGACRAVRIDGLPESFEYCGERDLFLTKEFHSGEFELQDVSSQCVGLVCAPKPGETWWDACAGEGGKLLHLSDLMENKGLIWASDRAEWRLKQLKRRAARAQVFNYRAVNWDGSARLPTRTRFDGILIDAPCSGVGTWHRNPQARWTTTLQDVKELGALQVQLVINASQALKPGGKLIYAVCTLTRSETVEVCESVRKRRPELKPLRLRHPMRPGAADAEMLTLRLEEMGGNGMFVCGFTV